MTFGNLANSTYQEELDDPQDTMSACRLTPAEHLLEIKTVFGRTTPRLCSLFGISRETFSRWLEGAEHPGSAHERLLCEVAHAARVFLASGVRPTNAMFDRTIIHGKTFLQLLRQGASGSVLAERLVRILERDERSGKRLDAALAHSPKTPLSAEDFGAPAFEENAAHMSTITEAVGGPATKDLLST